MSEENIKLLKKAGLKITEPRLTILALMQEHKNEHFSAEEVYKILLEQGSDIGLATVYRVLNQFDEAHILIPVSYTHLFACAIHLALMYWFSQFAQVNIG